MCLKEDKAHILPNSDFINLMTAVLHRGASFRFTASGQSMSPFIHHEDVITIKSTSLRLGDIVAYVNPVNSRLAVHRIIHRSNEKILLKGDNNSIADGWFPASDILGRVVLIEHGGKRVKIGVGVERILLAWLSRRGWLQKLVANCRWVLRTAFRIFYR